MQRRCAALAGGLLAVCCALTTPVSRAEDWPQFRGPNSQGVSADGRPPVHFGKDTNLVWTTPTGPGASSPVVWGANLFLTSFTNLELTLHGFDTRTGTERWRRSTPITDTVEYYKHGPASASAVTDGRRAVVYDCQGILRAYDVDTGTPLWQCPVRKSFVRQGHASSPILADGKVILQMDQEQRSSHLVAVDVATGKVVWDTPRPWAWSSQSTPAVWEPHPGTTWLVTMGASRLATYDLATGMPRWFASVCEFVSVVPVPVIGRDRVFAMSRSLETITESLETWDQILKQCDKNTNGLLEFGEDPTTDQGLFLSFDANGDDHIDQAEYESGMLGFRKAEYGIFAVNAPKPDTAGDVTATHRGWRHKKVPKIASPLLFAGRLYLVDEGGRVTCLDPGSGEPVYEQERLGADGQYYASPVAGDGRIYFASYRGVVSVVRPGATLDVVARNTVDEGIQATPALVGDRIYVRTADHLWAFAVR